MARIGVVSEQGMRGRMEDSHAVQFDLFQSGDIFGGVYDGHAGSYAAIYASQVLHLHFAEALREGLAPEEAFARSYREVSRELEEQSSGATAVTFYLRQSWVIAANAGDTRAIIVDSRDVRQLTRDHRVEDPQERERVESSGGTILGSYVMRGGEGLMPTRTLGDPFFEEVGVIPDPEVHAEELRQADQWLVVACDGLFDVLDNEEVAEVVRKAGDAQEAADALGREALMNRMGMDNLTAIVVDLRR